MTHTRPLARTRLQCWTAPDEAGPGLEDTETSTAAQEADSALSAQLDRGNAYDGEDPLPTTTEAMADAQAPSGGVWTRVSGRIMAYFQGYVQYIKSQSEGKARKLFSLQSGEDDALIAQKRTNAAGVIPMSNEAALHLSLQTKIERFSPRQLRAYDQAAAAATQASLPGDANWQQMIMFLSGQGGTGNTACNSTPSSPGAGLKRTIVPAIPAFRTTSLLCTSLILEILKD